MLEPKAIQRGMLLHHLTVTPGSITTPPQRTSLLEIDAQKARIRSLIFPIMATNSKVGYNIISHYIKVYQRKVKFN